MADGGVLIGVGGQMIVGLTAPDIDELQGETIESISNLAVARLEQALDEADEARRPMMLLRSSALALVAVGVSFMVIRLLARRRRDMANNLLARARHVVTRTGLHDQHAQQATSRVEEFLRRLVAIVFVGMELVVVYGLVTFTLRQFPYTRPWGETLRASLLKAAGHLVIGMVDALPNLFTILAIIVLTRFAVGLLEPWFDAIGRGAIDVPWVYPETARPTRRLVTSFLWLFAAAVAYPYVPGRNTDAFKGLSIFVGLMLTLGSSGFVNQVMSGLMLTYSRALRLGDFVKIGASRNHHARGRAVDQAEDAKGRRGHHPERRRGLPEGDRLLAIRRIGSHHDGGDDRVRRAVAAGARLAAPRGRAHL